MSPFSLLPRTAARFRRKEIDALHVAVNFLIASRGIQVKHGQSKNTFYWRIMPHRRPANDRFDQELMDFVQALWSRLSVPAREKNNLSCRFALNTVEIWILTLCIALVRHHNLHTSSERLLARKLWSNLLRKLERLQRRARRAWRSSENGHLYQPYRARWTGFRAWLEIHFGCLCREPAMVRIQFRRTLFLDRGVAVAKEALTRIELQLPSDKDLRIYVRLAFREIRRGRHNMSILELMRGGRTAQYFLGYFIRDRLRKTNRLFELYPDPTY